MKVNCKVNTKANPILPVKYIFKTMDNDQQAEEDQAYAMVKHLTTKELQKYLTPSIEGVGYDSAGIFMNQVKKIVNIHNTATDSDMTKQEILESSANMTTYMLVQEVVTFLIAEVMVTGEEVKN